MAINERHVDELRQHLADAFSDSLGDNPELCEDEIAYDLIQSVVFSHQGEMSKDTLREFVRTELGPGVMEDLLR